MESNGSRHLICPCCHTPGPADAGDALRAHGDWQCLRCGARWDARRLATVAAYESWERERSRGMIPVSAVEVLPCEGHPSAL